MYANIITFSYNFKPTDNLAKKIKIEHCKSEQLEGYFDTLVKPWAGGLEKGM